ncbi:hypothetical protein BU15DRAFT_62136 [Melanogaster broomeanus]|nr:hypothetical protein BU15DRAFT_62136 [Melanogaster broomeanus]
MGETQRHTRFYMDTVTFLVEDCLFKVPRNRFETESTVFRDMFLLPAGDLHEVEGRNDEKPIRLEGIKKDEFEQLLKVLLHWSYTSQSQELPGDVEQWTSVLKLSTLWDLSSQRQIAIDKLSELPVPPIDKIILANTYDVKPWLLPAMHDLVRRQDPINMEDASRLGFETALKLASVREKIALRTVTRSCWNCYCTTSNTSEIFVGPRLDAEALDFTAILRTTFDLQEIDPPLSQLCIAS